MEMHLSASAENIGDDVISCQCTAEIKCVVVKACITIEIGSEATYTNVIVVAQLQPHVIESCAGCQVRLRYRIAELDTVVTGQYTFDDIQGRGFLEIHQDTYLSGLLRRMVYLENAQGLL